MADADKQERGLRIRLWPEAEKDVEDLAKTFPQYRPNAIINIMILSLKRHLNEVLEIAKRRARIYDDTDDSPTKGQDNQ